MSVELIFPPPWDTSQPYLSVPSLAAELQKFGITCHQTDLNLEFHDYLNGFSTTENLTEILRRKASGREDNEAVAARWALASLPSLKENTDYFSHVMRSQMFYEPAQYGRAHRHLQKVCDVWSAAFHPTVLTPITFRANLNAETAEEWKKFVTDEQRNPVLEFARNYCKTWADDPPNLFGISVVYNDQLLPSLTIAEQVKLHFPDAKVILGGHAISQCSRLHWREVLANFGCVDFLSIDDGYEHLRAVARSIDTQSEVPPLPNLIQRSNDTEPRITTPRTESFNAPARPAYEGLPLERYHSPSVMLSFKTSKGCKWGKCTFCSESAFKEYSETDIDRTVSAIASYVTTHGLTFVNFADSDISSERFLELSRAIIEQGLEISWSIRARFDPRFTAEILEIGAQSGCKKIYFGLESASQRLLKKMKKGTALHNVRRILDICYELGIHTHLFSFMGFPTETKEEARKTKEFLWENISKISSFNIGVFQLRKFSDVFFEREELGLATADSRVGDIAVDNIGYSVESGMSQSEAWDAQREALEFFRQKFIDLDLPFDINMASGYVNLRGAPYWDCHNLAYAERLFDQIRQDHLPCTAFKALPQSIVRLGEGPSTSTVYLEQEFRTLTMPSKLLQMYERAVHSDGQIVDQTSAGSLLEKYGLCIRANSGVQ
ncbi:B12-binding domain-containing radical SAM protein [Dinoroseobacter sp. S375]|uniref:B12-binding domain-containing radical SAM protein n=1 Tax=Dinoroseobacter sp. S375 TaxID=3415136 RepID=UPI003C7E6E9D